MTLRNSRDQTMNRNLLIAIVAGLCLLLSACAQRTQPVPALIDEFSGRGQPQPRSPADLQAAYEEVIRSLLPGMSAPAIPDREKPQQTLESICFHAGRPGAEVERAALCRAMCRLATPDTPPPARVWLLRQLERLGAAESTPALTAILSEEDPEIRDLARRVLQNNSDPAAAAALRGALEVADNPDWEVALINTLAARRDRDEDTIRRLRLIILTGDDAPARASVAALGDLAEPDSTRFLLMLWTDGPNDVRSALGERSNGSDLRTAVADALFRAADRIADENDPALAGLIYDALYASGHSQSARTAALRGRARLHGADVIPELLRIITDPGIESPLRAQAAELAGEIPGPMVTAALTQQLPGATPDGQVLLLQILAVRGDVSARLPVTAMLRGEQPAVCAAAARALARLGNHDTVGPLLGAAATGNPALRDEVRRCLARLAADGVDEALIAGAREGPAVARVESLAALQARRCRTAMPAFLAAAADSDESVQAAAWNGLGALGTEADLPKLLKLIPASEALPEPVAQNIEDALAGICLRNSDAAARSAHIVAAWDAPSPVARTVLIRVLGRLGGPASLQRVRAARRDPDPELADTAVRALAGWPDAEAIGDLMDVARTSDHQRHRVLALQGCIRLIGLPSSRSDQQSLALYEAALAAADRPEEKRSALAGLAKIADVGALRLVERYTSDAQVGAEAQAAVLALTPLVGPQDNSAMREAIERVLAEPTSDTNRDAATKAMESLQEIAGNITTWRAAGPYFEEGRDWQYVRDHAFAPELPDAPGVAWHSLPITNRTISWVFDLASLDNQPNRCVYVRSAVWSEKGQPVRLLVGSDDAVKVWVNGRLVYEFRGVRGHSPLENQFPATLEAGWNQLLLKVIQAEGGWGFSCGIRNPDGGPLAGLRFAAEPPAPTTPTGSPTP